MKLCFEEIGYMNLIAKNLISILYRFVPAQCKKKFSHHSISASDFCKDLRKLACFATFERKWAGLIVKKVKNRKFETYWLTLRPTAVCTSILGYEYWLHPGFTIFWVCYHSSLGLKYTYRVTKYLQIYGWTVLLLVGVKIITKMF